MCNYSLLLLSFYLEHLEEDLGGDNSISPKSLVHVTLYIQYCSSGT